MRARSYRDLIFEMAFFIDRHGGEVTRYLVRKFIGRRPKNDIIASFSEAEVCLLMKKAVEYELPVGRRTPSTKGAICEGFARG